MTAPRAAVGSAQRYTFHPLHGALGASMSSRPRRPPASPPAASDLDSTAELPVLEVPAPAASTPATTAKVAASGTGDPLATTGTWTHPLAEPAASSAAAASGEEQRRQQLELESRTTALKEAEERLASHAKRLLQLEQARDEALASQAAAAQRAASAEQRAAAAEQRGASLEQRLAEVEQRAAAAAGQLAQARALVSASGLRTQELQQRLEQQESDTRERRTHELERQQALAAAGRVHADGMMQDLHNERVRAMTYLESLQTLERRREISQHLVTELHHEAAAREAEVVRVS